MEFFPNYPAGSQPSTPAQWAQEMESLGWHGICASDHLWTGNTLYPHVFVAATTMACVTKNIKLTTSFCNNLFRSPVEFAQAAISLQNVSNGRFEAGLGAGWAEDEIVAMGKKYPKPGERVSMYIESLQIAKQLMHTGQCKFSGDYYQVDITGDKQLGPLAQSPPPLVASAGGPRAIREAAPLVDRIEIKASARATRGGTLDFSVMPSVTKQEVLDNVQRVKDVADVPISIFLLVACGDSPEAIAMNKMFGDGFLGQFMGEPRAVANALLELEEVGIDRVQLTQLAPGTLVSLAPHLLG